jgi:tetratricopeptide (TPR) repeat protein
MMGKYLIFILILSACTSGQKNNSSSNASNTNAGMSDEEMSGSEPAPIGDESQTAMAEPPPAKGDAAYEAFSKAIRSKSESLVTTEASKLLSYNPKDLKALNGLAMFYYSIGRPQMAKIPLARAIAAHPDSATLANNLGLIYLAEDRPREAITEFRRALTLDQGHAEASYHLGSIFIRYKNHINGLPLLERAYSSLQRKEIVGPHYAEALRLSGNFKKSEDIYEDIKAENSSNPMVLLNYANLLVDNLKSKKQGLKIINKLRFLTQDADILKKVDELSDRAEAIK